MTPDEEDLLDHVFDYLCEEQPETVAEIADEEIRRRACGHPPGPGPRH